MTPRFHALLSLVCWSLATLASLAIIATTVFVADRGFDITDEAWYVLWSTEPAQYLYSGTMFGHLLAPLMKLAGGDIALFRIFGLAPLLIVAGSCWVAWLGRRIAPPLVNMEASICLAALSLFALGAEWLATPSYNTLAILGGFALLAAMGLLTRDAHWSLAALLAALAGLCAVASRPTAGAMYGLIYAVGIVLTARSARQALRNFAAAGVATAAVALLLGLFVVDAPAIWRQYAVFWSLWIGAGDLVTQTGSQMRNFMFSASQGGLLLAGFGLVCLAAAVRQMLPRTAIRVTVAVASAYLALAIFLLQDADHPAPLVMLMTCGAISAAAIAVPANAMRPYIMLALATLIPFAALVGTNNSLAHFAFIAMGITAAVTVIVAGRVLGGNAAAIVALALTLVLGNELRGSLSVPYRLPADMWSQMTAFAFPRHGTLHLDGRTYAMLHAAREAGRADRLGEDAPVLDFTGQSPGIVLAMGGSTPGLPWLVGGYDWSDRQLVAVLQSLNEDTRRRAWILWGDNPRAVKRNRLLELGFDLDKDYVSVAHLTHSSRDWTVGIYAPRRNGDAGQ